MATTCIEGITGNALSHYTKAVLQNHNWAEILSCKCTAVSEGNRTGPLMSVHRTPLFVSELCIILLPLGFLIMEVILEVEGFFLDPSDAHRNDNQQLEEMTSCDGCDIIAPLIVYCLLCHDQVNYLFQSFDVLTYCWITACVILIATCLMGCRDWERDLSLGNQIQRDAIIYSKVAWWGVGRNSRPWKQHRLEFTMKQVGSFFKKNQK